MKTGNEAATTASAGCTRRGRVGVDTKDLRRKASDDYSTVGID
jgi:hypothetical protein